MGRSEVLGTLLLRGAQSQFEAYLTDSARLSGTLPLAPAQSQMPTVAPSGCGESGHEAGVSPTGSRHGRGGGLADERSPGSGAGPFAALVGTRECLGRGLAARRAGATFRLRPGGLGPTVRSQCELGVTSLGLGRASSGQRAATSACRRDPGAGGDEVFGAGGAWQPGRLSADGRGVCAAQVDEPASRAGVCRLARSFAPDPA